MRGDFSDPEFFLGDEDYPYPNREDGKRGGRSLLDEVFDAEVTKPTEEPRKKKDGDDDDDDDDDDDFLN